MKSLSRVSKLIGCARRARYCYSK